MKGSGEGRRNGERGGSGGEANRERLWPVAASCPACGARAALRVAGWLLERIDEEDARRQAASYRCRRRGCGTIYEIAVAALRGPP